MSVDRRVTRLEIAEAVAPAFGGGSATRNEIVESARAASRSEVIAVLQGLPDRRYGRLNELWEELHDVPVGG